MSLIGIKRQCSDDLTSEQLKKNLDREEFLQVKDEPGRKLQLSFNNLYGALLFDNNIAIFTNKDKFIFNEKHETIIDGQKRFHFTQKKITEQQQIKDIKSIFMKRL